MRTAEEELFAAMDLAAAGKYDRAVKIYNRLITRDPKNTRAYFGRGVAYAELGQDENALADFRTAVELDPDLPGARDWFAKMSDKLGNHAEAAEVKLRELRARPEKYKGMGVSPADWADAATYFVRAGQVDRAIETLVEYFRDHAKKESAYADASTAPMRLYAELMLGKGEFQKARKMAELALANPYRRPIDELVWVRTLAATGDVTQAREELEKILAETPDWDKAKKLKKELFPDKGRQRK